MIGIFGGTFDPIHIGHLRTASDVQQALGLEQIRLIPLQSPPHRPPPIATAQQRTAMLEAAIADNPDFIIDLRELNRSGLSYTVETLQSLRQELPEETLCLIIGSDAFKHFPEWHQPEEILNLAHLIVMHRPGDPIAEHYSGRHINDPAMLKAQPTGLIFSQIVTQLDVSSTQIRALLKQGGSPRYLLPKATLDIIIADDIYR